MKVRRCILKRFAHLILYIIWLTSFCLSSLISQTVALPVRRVVLFLNTTFEDCTSEKLVLIVPRVLTGHVKMRFKWALLYLSHGPPKRGFPLLTVTSQDSEAVMTCMLCNRACKLCILRSRGNQAAFLFQCRPRMQDSNMRTTVRSTGILLVYYKICTTVVNVKT